MRLPSGKLSDAAAHYQIASLWGSSQAQGTKSYLQQGAGGSGSLRFPFSLSWVQRASSAQIRIMTNKGFVSLLSPFLLDSNTCVQKALFALFSILIMIYTASTWGATRASIWLQVGNKQQRHMNFIQKRMLFSHGSIYPSLCGWA